MTSDPTLPWRRSAWPQSHHKLPSLLSQALTPYRADVGLYTSYARHTSSSRGRSSVYTPPATASSRPCTPRTHPVQGMPPALPPPLTERSLEPPHASIGMSTSTTCDSHSRLRRPAASTCRSAHARSSVGYAATIAHEESVENAAIDRILVAFTADTAHVVASIGLGASACAHPPVLAIFSVDSDATAPMRLRGRARTRSLDTSAPSTQKGSRDRGRTCCEDHERSSRGRRNYKSMN